MSATDLPSRGACPDSRPRPPGARLVTLPRQALDKPQEVSLAVNPRDPRNVAISFHQAIGAGSDHHPGMKVDAHVACTLDGGRTWTIATDTTHPDYDRSLDACITFDRNGHAFLAYIGMDKMRFMSPSTTRHGEFVARSVDGGRTWEKPVALIARPETDQEPIFEHFPNIASDIHPDSPHAGNIYVVWDRMHSLTKEDMVIVRSTDGGTTWSEPKTISSHDARLAHSTAVGPDGTVYISNAELTVGEWQFLLHVSRDGGETFEPPFPIMRAKPSATSTWAAADFPRACGLPNIAADPRDGRLYLAWGDHRYGDADILVSTSSDAGRTWSEPVRANDDPQGNGRDQVMHWLAVDPSDGSVYVLFYDRRDDPQNLRPTVTLARSTDGGRSFANYAWSDAASDPSASCLGDYIGVGAVDGHVYAAWVESVPMPEGTPAPQPQQPEAGDMNLAEGDWPFGPTAIRVGIADFRSR